MGKLKVGVHELQPFTLSTKGIMEQYLKRLNLETSDYTFAANYLWISGGSGFYSIIDDTFCLFLLTHGELSMLLPPLGSIEHVIDSMKTCFSIMEDNNTSPAYTKIEYVDESLLAAFTSTLMTNADIFDAFPDYVVTRSFNDYVYHCSDLITLQGNLYKNKRNEINKFIKIHPNYRVERLDVSKHGDDVLRLMDQWVTERLKYMPNEESDYFLEGIYSERTAVKRMLKDYEDLMLVGLALFIDDKLSGFTAGEQISDSTACVIFEKTDFNILGCAQFIFREFAKILYSEYGTTFINVGDDMGFDNLKKVKMSYRPVRMPVKYTIYRKQ
jgi:hypothetical protein